MPTADLTSHSITTSLKGGSILSHRNAFTRCRHSNRGDGQIPPPSQHQIWWVQSGHCVNWRRLHSAALEHVGWSWSEARRIDSNWTHGAGEEVRHLNNIWHQLTFNINTLCPCQIVFHFTTHKKTRWAEPDLESTSLRFYVSIKTTWTRRDSSWWEGEERNVKYGIFESFHIIVWHKWK